MIDWNAADAKVNFGTLLEEAGTEPQRIVKRGTPAAVLVSYRTWLTAEPLLQGARHKLWDELADINSREPDFEPAPRADRPAAVFD